MATNDVLGFLSRAPTRCQFSFLGSYCSTRSSSSKSPPIWRPPRSSKEFLNDSNDCIRGHTSCYCTAVQPVWHGHSIDDCLRQIRSQSPSVVSHREDLRGQLGSRQRPSGHDHFNLGELHQYLQRRRAPVLLRTTGSSRETGHAQNLTQILTEASEKKERWQQDGRFQCQLSLSLTWPAPPATSLSQRRRPVSE